MKAFTDIEQSKALAKILPIESADMFYLKIPNSSEVGYNYSDLPYFASLGIKDNLPAWSLAALLSVYPMVVGRDMDMYCCWQNSKNLHSRHYDNPIDACVEMILKLHKEKLL